MNKEKIKAYLEDLNQHEYINIQGTDKKRLTFKKSEEIFNIYRMSNNGVLEPFDDYSYEWLNNFLIRVVEFIDYTDFEDLEELNNLITDELPEWTDGEVNVYTSDLTEWLNSSNYNVEYITQAQREYGQQDDGFKLLSMAQYTAINEHFYKSLEIMIKDLKENFEEEE